MQPPSPVGSHMRRCTQTHRHMCQHRSGARDSARIYAVLRPPLLLRACCRRCCCCCRCGWLLHTRSRLLAIFTNVIITDAHGAAPILHSRSERRAPIIAIIVIMIVIMSMCMCKLYNRRCWGVCNIFMFKCAFKPGAALQSYMCIHARRGRPPSAVDVQRNDTHTHTHGARVHGCVCLTCGVTQLKARGRLQIRHTLGA